MPLRRWPSSDPERDALTLTLRPRIRYDPACGHSRKHDASRNSQRSVIPPLAPGCFKEEAIRMSPISLRYFALALVALVLARPAVRGDYFESVSYKGKVTVTAYQNWSGFGTPPGQVQIYFNGAWYGGSGQGSPDFLDTVAFNTDLHLSPNQITVPKGWTLTPNAVVPGFGRFSWVLHTSDPNWLDLFPSVTIDGLGSNAAASHFWQSSTVAGIAPPATPASFAFHDGALAYYQGADLPWLHVPQGADVSWFSIDAGPPQYAALTPSPEPSALVLCGVGLAALLGWNVLRRRRARIRYFALALAALLLTRPPARGDYFRSERGHYGNGSVRVTTYPDSSFSGTTPRPGQVRIDFDGSWTRGAGPESLDTVAFNTDLHLAPSQISVPKGWTLAPNGVVPGFGRFSWVLHTPDPNFWLVSVTITGLGSNAAPSHFWQSSTVAGTLAPATPATFAFHDAVILERIGFGDYLRFPQGPDTGWFSIGAGPPDLSSVTPSPEPSALVLFGVGLAALLGWNVLRRRRAQAPRLIRT
jgi:hypothetical protein